MKGTITDISITSMGKEGLIKIWLGYFENKITIPMDDEALQKYHVGQIVEIIVK